MENFEAQLKGMVEDLVNKYISFVGTDAMQKEIFTLIAKHYDLGIQSGEAEFDMNFTPDYKALNFVQKFAFDNVKGLADEMKDQLRKEMSLGLLNNEGITELKERIVKVMDTTIERAKMIAITESNRAHNAGHMQAARESNLNLVKQWNAQPERISRAGNQVPCPVCEFLDGQIVGVNDKFKDNEGNEILQPPRHPRCACRLIFIQKEDLPKVKGGDTGWRTTKTGKHYNIFNSILNNASSYIDEKELIDLDGSMGFSSEADSIAHGSHFDVYIFKDFVVKVPKREDIDKKYLQTYVEYANKVKNLSAFPKVSLYEKHGVSVLIETRMKGKSLKDLRHTLDDATKNEILTKIKDTLTELKDKAKLVHKDIHDENVLYDQESKSISIIDLEELDDVVSDEQADIIIDVAVKDVKSKLFHKKLKKDLN